MKNRYIKEFPRGAKSEQDLVESGLPICTNRLNELYRGLFFIKKLKELSLKNDTDIYNKLDAIENHGKFNAFLNICFLDLTVIKKNSLSATHIWDDIYNLRQGYLLMYEALKTFNTHSKFLNELALKTSGKAVEMFNQIKLQLKAFRKEYNYEKDISKIRNHTIGHIENDPVSLFEQITKIDNEKAFSALKSFGIILAKMLNLSDYIFANYTKKITAKYSLEIAVMNTNSKQIEDFLNDLKDKDFISTFNGS